VKHPNELTRSKATLKLVFCICIFILPIPFAYAQSIPITQSGSMGKVIFDGKWTFAEEWKQSSYDEIRTESGIIYLRTAHQENFIYILIDFVPDNTIDNNEDLAVVCFDTKNDKNVKPDENDYCFKIKLGSDKPATLQGSGKPDGFNVVENNVGLIAVGGASDENDRYSKIPHTTYEFRIPIELLERTDHYGFYVQVFDSTKSGIYTWPSEIDLESNSDIASPDKWGVIYSPDKSLPEYEIPILVLFLGSLSIILLSLKNKKQNLFYFNR